MELAERTNSNEVNFAAKNKYGHYENYYYVLKLQAEQDERLLKSNEWDVFFTKQKINTRNRGDFDARTKILPST